MQGPASYSSLPPMAGARSLEARLLKRSFGLVDMPFAMLRNLRCFGLLVGSPGAHAIQISKSPALRGESNAKSWRVGAARPRAVP